MELLLVMPLVAGIINCLIACSLVFGVIKDRHCDKREINVGRLTKHIILSFLAAMFSFATGAWTVACVWAISAALIALAIGISNRNRKRYLASLVGR
jgi:uncharacterized membrane protein YoaK (UPF0700 family)